MKLAIILITLFSNLIIVPGVSQIQTEGLSTAKCVALGGTPWRVDYAHPAICPECLEYQDCAMKIESRANVMEVCPSAIRCMDCRQRLGIYPADCPNGMRKMDKIWDTNVPFQCCK